MLKKSYALALFSVISWASAPIIFKSLVSGMDFASAVFFFLVFGAISMFFYVSVTDWRNIRLKPENYKYVGLLGFCTYAHYMFYCYSLSVTDASLVIALVKLSPIFQVLLAVAFLKEKVNARAWPVLFLGFVGAAIVVSNGSLEAGTILAYGAALLAGFAWAVFMIATKKSGMNDFSAVGWGLLVGATMTGGHLWLFGSIVLPVNDQWFWLFILGAIPTAAAVVAWVKALDECIQRVVHFDYLTAPLGVILSWIILKDTINIWLIMGLVVILSSIFISTRINKSCNIAQ